MKFSVRPLTIGRPRYGDASAVMMEDDDGKPVVVKVIRGPYGGVHDCERLAGFLNEAWDKFHGQLADAI